MIMFVDDQAWILKALKKTFGPRSFGVKTVAEALEAAVTFQPEVVLIDVWLGPRESGIDAVPMLKKLLPRATIIVFTAACSSEGRKASKAAGAHAYIDKMHIHRIREIVEDITSDVGPSSRELMH